MISLTPEQIQITLEDMGFPGTINSDSLYKECSKVAGMGVIITPAAQDKVRAIAGDKSVTSDTLYEVLAKLWFVLMVKAHPRFH